MKLIKPFTLWLTGLSGAGKSTLAREVNRCLEKKGLSAVILDGDDIRKYLSPDLGYTKKDRDENVKRIAFVARLLTDNGIPVIVAAISPYRDARKGARAITGGMLEVYVKCPRETCEKRDVKGLYREARAGRIRNFTGLSDPYEEPELPDLTVETDRNSVDLCAAEIICRLEEKGYLKKKGGYSN